MNWQTIEMKYSRNRVFDELLKTLTAPRVLNVTSSYLLSDFPPANFSRAISAFLNIPDGSPAKFEPNTLTQ